MAVSEAASEAAPEAVSESAPQVVPTGRRERALAALRGPRLWLWVVAIAVVAPQPWHQVHVRGDVLVDLHVYRQAGISLLHHRPVYVEYVNTQYSLLPFTYPPTAALLAVPLVLLPLRGDGVLWSIAVYGVLAASLRLLLVPITARLRASRPRLEPLLLPAAFVLAAYLLPVRQQIRFGQVGMFLLGLVLLDLLTPRLGRWRGALVGLAIAIKLTPGVFVVAFLLARRWRAAAVATASFLLVAAITWAVAPSTSAAYWTDNLFHSDRLGNNADPANQSLRGMLLRTGLHGPPSTVVLAVATVAVAAIGLYVTTQAWQRGDELLGLTTAGLLSCLLSPVAWVHHFVYLLPLLALLLRDARYRVAFGLAALWALDFATDYDHHVAQGGPIGALWQLVSDEFGLTMIAVVVWFGVSAWRARSRPGAAARTVAEPALV